MNDYKRRMRLNEAFQYVDDAFLDIAEQEKQIRKKKPVWVYLCTAAACICLFFVVPFGVIAGKWFGLKDLVMREGNETESESGNTLITMSGFMGCPESKALAEWEEFLAGYDTDHAILDQIGNDVFVAEGREDWSLYNVYSYEMGNKLDEIAAKYGLKLHNEINVVSPKEMDARVGGSFMEEDCLRYWGYIYDDGSFSFDGDVELKSGELTMFQFIRCVKGSFDERFINVGQIETYTEWQYVTAGGDPILLAMNDSQSLILADFEECFITVNVMGGNSGITKEQLQQFADKIDFEPLKNVRIPKMRGDSQVSDETQNDYDEPGIVIDEYTMSFYTDAPNDNSSIRIEYPEFWGYGTEELNEMIYVRVQELAQIDMSLFPEDAVLTIDYQSEVTFLTDKFASIIFWGPGYIEGEAYPMDQLFSMNVNLQTMEELTLEDMYVTNEEFETVFFERAFFPIDPVTSYDESSFAEMLALQSQEYQTISPFSRPGNVICFLKIDGVVFSMPAVHATGSDHFEAQLRYSDIEQFFLPEDVYF